MKKPEKSVIEKAIIKSFGNLSLASKALGVDRVTLYKWIEQEALEQAVIEGRNTRLDFVESKLDQKIDSGDTTAIIFFLKTQGKSRGYIERQEVTGLNGQKLFEVTIVDGDSETENK